MVMQELTVCAPSSRPQAVQVVDVRPVTTSGGWVTTGWGHIPFWKPGMPERATMFRSTLARAKYATGPVAFLSRCGDKDADGNATNSDIPLTFALEAHRSTTTSAFAEGVTVEYVSNGQHATTTIPVVLAICADGDRDCGNEATKRSLQLIHH
jgi:hypothetical protein